jgi:hypothetical protein
MGHFGPKLEAERDETLGQNLRERVRRLQSSLLDLRHLRVRPSRHTIIYVLSFINSALANLFEIVDFLRTQEDVREEF